MFAQTVTDAGLYFGIALCMTLFFVPLVKRFSFRLGYVDDPSGNSLKIHASPIPHSGGIAIFGVFVLLVLFLFISEKTNDIRLAGLSLAGSFAFFLGVWDDLKMTVPWLRLCSGIAAGVILLLFGYFIKAPFFIGIPLTIFYVVGAINAVNLEDGLDGLAGGMAAISLVGFAVLSIGTNQYSNLFFSIILCGSIIGFLFYNFDPASLFMGDSGSYFIGFVLAYLAIGFTDLSHWSTFLGPILIIGVPVFDAAYAILRRINKGVSPFSGDRSHFYDQLMQKGLSVRQTVLICWAIQAVFVASGTWIYLAQA